MTTRYRAVNTSRFEIIIFVCLMDGSCYAKTFKLPLEPREGLLVNTVAGPLVLDKVWCDEGGRVWAFVEDDDEETERRKAELIGSGFITDIEHQEKEEGERRNARNVRKRVFGI